MKQGKVLSVCTSDSSGGAARAAYRIHQAVRELGVDSRMFVKDKGTSDSSVLSVDEFVPHNPLYMGFDWFRNKCKNQLQHYLWGRYPDRKDYYMSDLRSMDIGGALNKIDYDVLHLHWINQRFLPLDKLPKSKPIVWTLHDCWPFCGVCHYFMACTNYKNSCGSCPQLSSTNTDDLSNVIWRQKANKYKELDLHIVTPSQWLGVCAKESALLGSFPISVIPNCVDDSAFRPLNDDEISPRWQTLQRIRRSTPLVLYGAMNATKDKIKGFSNLLSALDLLNKKSEVGFELVVFGADRPITGLSDFVPTHYVGYVTDERELVSLYSLASVVVVPSHTENLSCAIMESLSCGTPVVAFDIGGNCDMIEHKVNGYLARELNDEDLANGIEWCLENNHRRELSENARKRVMNCFTPKAVGEEYLQLYSSLL